MILSLLLASSKYTTDPHTSATLPSPSLPQIQWQHKNDLQLPFMINRKFCTLNRIHVRWVWWLYVAHACVRKNCEPPYALQRAATPRDSRLNAHTHVRTNALLHTRKNKQTHARTHSHERTHTRTHTRTHIHTHARPKPVAMP